MKTYKAFDKDLKCNGYQFEIGKEYEHDGDIEICKSGFHGCENPLDVLNYYDLCDSRFAEVGQSGETDKHKDDSKVVSSKIKIKAELDLKGFIDASIKFLFKKSKTTKNIDASSGYYSQLASSGDSSRLASSGDSSKLASSGYSSQLASSGHSSQLASSGEYSRLASEGKDSVVANIGANGKAKGIKGNWITLAEYKDYKPICVKSVKIDGKRIKENTWYKLENKKFAEVQ